MAVISLDDQNFDQQISKGITLVDFYADWCGPCKKMAPALISVAEKLTGKITVAKVNVDESPKLYRRFNIRGIPMLLVIKDGTVINKAVGAKSEQELLLFVDMESE